MRIRLPAIAAHAMFALILFPTSATSDATAEPLAVQQEMETLKQQIRDLRARVERLEESVAKGLPVNPARTVQPVPGGWRKSSNWDLLVEGMQKDDVEKILGEPQRRNKVNKFEFWIYGEGKARIYFGRLKSWQIPPTIDSQ